MYEFRMPSLGADMAAGTLSRWLVAPGDRVNRGDIVAIIETEKSDIEVEIFASGVVDRILVEKGARVPVGTPLATLLTDGDAVAVPAAEISEAQVPGGPGGGSPSQPSPPAPLRSSPTALRSSPLARKMAEVLGVDLSRLVGTGPGGAITKADVEAAARAAQNLVKAGAAPVPAAEPRDRAASIRRAIGAAMARSKREIPHYYLATEIDLSRALAWLDEENRRRSVEERLLPAALLLKAVALALRTVPELNGFWADDAFRPSEAIHVGVAISLRGGGLIAPALHDADKKSVGELMAALGDLVRRTRAGSLRSSEYADPTVTVTQLGDQGVATVFGVIYPPQVALVGLGKIVERPWAEQGMLAVRPTVTATLAADHRASDGHRGGLFLAALDRLLQKPEEL